MRKLEKCKTCKEAQYCNEHYARYCQAQEKDVERIDMENYRYAMKRLGVL